MTGKDVRKLSDEELAKWVSDLRREMQTLRMQQVTEKIEDNSRFRKIRRDIARLLTEQTSRREAGDQ
ncbi:MAG: 50S ribosomal protein L29 [Phycisphaerales bacterium JB039]